METNFLVLGKPDLLDSWYNGLVLSQSIYYESNIESRDVFLAYNTLHYTLGMYY